ncbi:MAG: hypothetical protein ACLFV4_03465 [Candidatus Hydrogenedentota bacterium]
MASGRRSKKRKHQGIEAHPGEKQSSEQSVVLYLRLIEHRYAPAYSEETDDGLLLVRREDNGKVAGMTIVNWWKRCGDGPLPDSLHQLEQAIAPWAERLAA